MLACSSIPCTMPSIMTGATDNFVHAFDVRREPAAAHSPEMAMAPDSYLWKVVQMVIADSPYCTLSPTYCGGDAKPVANSQL